MRKKFFILLAAIAVLAMAGCQDHIQTNAPLNLVTDAPEATNTPVSANEATPELTPTDVPTPEPTPTNTPTPEPTPTDVPTPEPTPTDVPTPEPTPTDMPTPEPTPTDVPTPEPTPTDVPTPEPTPTDIPKVTVTPKPTDKPKATPTPKPKQSKKVSVNATVKENEEYTDCVVEIELDELYKLCKEDDWAEYTKEDIDANIEFWNAVEFERNNGVTIIGVKDKSVEHLVIPENVIWLFIDNDFGFSSIDTNSVNRIGKEAFKDCVNLKSVTFSSYDRGRVTIEDYAFSGCTGLKTFTAYNILEVGEGAFYGCRSLKNIELVKESTSIERINKRSFYGCSSLISVKYQGDIPDEAFAGCTSLETLELWSWCKKFGEASFKGCKNLKLPTNAFKEVTNVGDEAFYGCESIDTVVFVTDSSMPHSEVYIGDSAFYGCTGLTTLEIPYMVMSIGERAFYGCTGLKGELSIGMTVKYIGAYAFAGCSNLTSVQLPMNEGPNKAEYLFTEVNDGIFENCTSLTEVQVPYIVLKIAENAFNGCENLKEITVSGMERRHRVEEGQGGWKEYDFVVDPYYVDNWAASHGYEVKTHYNASGSSKGVQSSGRTGIR